MNTYNLSEGYIVENLSFEELVKITEKVGDVHEGLLCTVQIEEQGNGELSLYGVWEMTYDEAENYHNSGGVWSYFWPEHYIQILETEFKRRGLYAVDVRKA